MKTQLLVAALPNPSAHRKFRVEVKAGPPEQHFNSFLVHLLANQNQARRFWLAADLPRCNLLRHPLPESFFLPSSRFIVAVNLALVGGPLLLHFLPGSTRPYQVGAFTYELEDQVPDLWCETEKPGTNLIVDGARINREDSCIGFTVCARSSGGATATLDVGIGGFHDRDGWEG